MNCVERRDGATALGVGRAHGALVTRGAEVAGVVALDAARRAVVAHGAEAARGAETRLAAVRPGGTRHALAQAP